MKAGAGNGQSQDSRAQQETRGVELALDEIQLDEKQASDEHYDAEADEEDVAVEMITGGGGTHVFTVPPTATVLMLQQCVEHDVGIKFAEVKLYVHDDSREEALENEETLGSLRRGKGLAVLITLINLGPNAQEVVAGLQYQETDLDLRTKPSHLLVLQGTAPYGTAFVQARPDWVVSTEYNGGRIKISNIRTCALICKLGEVRTDGLAELGSGEGQFDGPWGVAVTSDSSFVIIADYNNHRMKVLRLVVAADGSSAHLEFVRHIGNGRGSGEGQLKGPSGVALLPGEGGAGQETVLVTDDNHRVSQFKLDGTFIRIFAGTGTRSSGDGEFDVPRGITVLGSSGEVAVADRSNHRVQIFDREGKYKRQFGSEGEEADGQFFCPVAVASDAHGNLLVLDDTNRLQVFSSEGKHLCTRNDLGMQGSAGGIAWSDYEHAGKGIAWSADGELAIANSSFHSVLVWRNTHDDSAFELPEGQSYSDEWQVGDY
jgi:DNA-binding beta-propeller fold protein YncE